jgi:hypothetical protein
MAILLSLFFISLFLSLSFKFITADGNYTEPLSLSLSLSLSLFVCSLIWLLKMEIPCSTCGLIRGFLFFSVGDFTLMSKRHVKREEIEDKVTEIILI